MNSGLRPPVSGNFSLGVWENLGAGVYKLNHFGIAWDPEQSIGTARAGQINRGP